MTTTIKDSSNPEVGKLIDELSQNNIGEEKREAVGILSLGTMFEYFDLFLYIYLASILNKEFFPSADPKSASLLAAFAFCSTFIFRPFGAMFFGYIGDKVGRRFTIIITTTLMGISCLIMFWVPTYSEIGIWASITVTICRILQGMSSLGEVTGAHVYIAETIRQPNKAASLSALITTSGAIGKILALFFAFLIISGSGNYRMVFLFGAAIAIFGLVCRTALRESCDFADANKRLPKDQHIEQKLEMKNVIAYFLMECIAPIAIYVAFVNCPMILAQQGHSAVNILSQNLVPALFEILGAALYAYFAWTIHPLKMLRFVVTAFIPVTFLMILLITYNPTQHMVLLFQIYIIFLVPSVVSAKPLIYKSFPILKRFRAAAVTFATSGAIMYTFTAFGIAILTNHLGMYGILIVLTPLTYGYIWGLNHFIKLEKEKGNFN